MNDEFIFHNFVIWILFCFIANLVCFVVSSVMDKKFKTYLKKNYYKEWEEITTIPGFLSGGMNPIRVRKYLKQNLHEDDERYLVLKKRMIFWSNQSMLGFLTLVGSCLYLIWLA